jgi:hypothetical protein
MSRYCDESKITGAGAAAKSLADVVAALLALRTAKTIDDIVTAVSAIPTDFEDVTGAGGSAKTLADIVTAISGILKSEMVTAKAAAWEAITTDTEFTPPAGTNGLTLSPKAASSGDTVAGTVWGKPSGVGEQYRIVEAFMFTCSTATLEADGFTDVMKCIDITGMTDIKVVFTGGELAYLPY